MKSTKTTNKQKINSESGKKYLELLIGLDWRCIEVINPFIAN